MLWKLNQPDRFDIYSAGIVLMQLAFSNLRSDSALIGFRNKLEDCDHDISVWRQKIESSERKGSQYTEGFALLDSQGGWDLVCKVRAPPHFVTRLRTRKVRSPCNFKFRRVLDVAEHR